MNVLHTISGVHRQAKEHLYEIQAMDCMEFLGSLDDRSVDVIVTDPAYSGMNQHMMFGNGRIVGRYQDEDQRKWFREFHDDPENFTSFLNECKRVLRPNRHIYVMFDSFSILTLGHLMRGTFNVKNIIIWDKINLGMGHYFRRRHELIIFACKGHRKLTRRDIPDIWRVKRVHRAEYPTQKPVELFEAMLCGTAEPGFTVCDPFTGSGSSAVAALKFRCKFVGCDLSEKAVSIANNRCKIFVETSNDPLQPLPLVSADKSMQFLL